ncbi:haloacid dehalogenase [Laetiporus sulphureus 93-53]|uniref:Haloacid dehalogenase n=1 Tax=Laetiporus sulphureus 93-53 TaxID=1314785 RepID=A0A165BEH2_9APHY|nr:haloacid dehalogenase [Laetiporus sulphureus 93-53]KZT00880.1 haloacid dehalogenase [Laetiporus sulphureus 93-53]
MSSVPSQPYLSTSKRSTGPSGQNPLKDVKAFAFDVWGTVVNWRKGVADQLRAFNSGKIDDDWDAFTAEWRENYYEMTFSIASGAEGTMNVDVMHRQILEKMLQTPRWKYLASHWDEEARRELVQFWHRVPGWPDTTEGLYGLKRYAIIGTLSNGNIRTLVDMAKYADLPWDVIFSSELLGSYKPNPKMYLGALHHLSLEPHQCAMVAAHIYDLRAAASHGMKTVFVRRPQEPDAPDDVRSKADGGEVDVYAESFTEVAELLERARLPSASL